MSERLTLFVPPPDALWYRRQLMEDPGTMDYNRGYALDIPGYHPDTGCIDFPEHAWRVWFDKWLGPRSPRFYAYIQQKDSGAWVGEACLYPCGEDGEYEMGVVLEGKYRGMGYGSEALSLLLQHAFCHMQARAVYNRFEATRKAAMRIHRGAGFSPVESENGIVQLKITREEYFDLHKIR